MTVKDPAVVISELDLDVSNSIVIGSGILQALNIRSSNDVDLVVLQSEYTRLSKSGKFSKELSYGQEILVGDDLEIRLSWEVLAKIYKFNDFKPHSILIDGVRYINLEFLERVKSDWLSRDKAREKDKKDIELIAQYKNKLVLNSE